MKKEKFPSPGLWRHSGFLASLAANAVYENVI